MNVVWSGKSWREKGTLRDVGVVQSGVEGR